MPAESQASGHTVPAGRGTPWTVAELPAPPAPTFRNIAALIGPGAMILALSIGSGEWLLGPKTAVEHGVRLLWITTVAVVLQTVFNIECTRYALYCGEPILVGFTRLYPGPAFWRTVWLVLLFVSIGPGWALGSATALAAVILGHLPGGPERWVVLACGLFNMVAVLALLSVGRSVQGTLERFACVAVPVTFVGLLMLVVRFVPAARWASTASGFLAFGHVPAGADWVLLAGFAAFSAAGGIFNTAVSNWFRDKGYGMGRVVGFIPALVGGRKVRFGAGGCVFPIHLESLRRWHRWMWYVRLDQWILFGLGALLGMYFCVLLAVGLIPEGTVLESWGIAAYQGEAVGRVMGPAGWVFVLGIGAWMLFASQLNCTDAFVRQATELLWHTSPRLRRRCGGDIRRVYYAILLALIAWTAALLVLGDPLNLLLLAANAAGAVFVVAGIQLLAVGFTLLPRPLRPGWPSRLVLVAAVGFYATFASVSIADAVGRWRARPTPPAGVQPEISPETTGSPVCNQAHLRLATARYDRPAVSASRRSPPGGIQLGGSLSGRPAPPAHHLAEGSTAFRRRITMPCADCCWQSLPFDICPRLLAGRLEPNVSGESQVFVETDVLRNSRCSLRCSAEHTTPRRPELRPSGQPPKRLRPEELVAHFSKGVHSRRSHCPITL